MEQEQPQAQPEPQKKRCSALCRNGTACLNEAIENSPYCWLHNQLSIDNT